MSTTPLTTNNTGILPTVKRRDFRDIQKLQSEKNPDFILDFYLDFFSIYFYVVKMGEKSEKIRKKILGFFFTFLPHKKI